MRISEVPWPSSTMRVEASLSAINSGSNEAMVNLSNGVQPPTQPQFQIRNLWKHRLGKGKSHATAAATWNWYQSSAMLALHVFDMRVSHTSSTMFNERPTCSLCSLSLVGKEESHPSSDTLGRAFGPDVREGPKKRSMYSNWHDRRVHFWSLWKILVNLDHFPS